MGCTQDVNSVPSVVNVALYCCLEVSVVLGSVWLLVEKAFHTHSHLETLYFNRVGIID